MRFKEWLRKYMGEYFENKKGIYNLIIILCIGVGIIITVDVFSGMNSAKQSRLQESENLAVASSGPISSGYEKTLETKLSEILSKIQGAGRVSVMVTLASSDEIEIAKDYTTGKELTTEKDVQGGEREISQSNVGENIVLVGGEGGGTKPIVVKEISPKVEGVIVVADGAKDADVKTKLYKAVETVLGISIYKISVFERN